MSVIAPVPASKPVTKPEELAASVKRTRNYSLYSVLLPIHPPIPAPSFIKSLIPSLATQQFANPLIQAVYDELTKTIWVQGEDDMVRLWRCGFFGKGALSRSEPAWKRRVQNMIAEASGGVKTLTSEEITAQRRSERKVIKLVKKAERAAEKLAAATAALPAPISDSKIIRPPSDAPSEDRDLEDAQDPDDEEPVRPEILEVDTALGRTGEEEEADTIRQVVTLQVPPLWHLAAEHTQLQQEEAFFLQFALGCLHLRSSDPLNPSIPTSNARLTILESWKLFLLDSATVLPPPLQPTLDHSITPGLDPRLSRWDSPFLLNYVAYHHYRSMGWVIRSGIKFCADWVVYGPGGPVGGHAEFAVVLIPTYANPADEASSPFRSAYMSSGSGAEGEKRNSWRWFNTVNRVCSGVKKTLVMLFVTIPPLANLPSPDFILKNPAQALTKFELREVTVRRWIAGRMRD